MDPAERRRIYKRNWIRTQRQVDRLNNQVKVQHNVNLVDDQQVPAQQYNQPPIDPGPYHGGINDRRIEDDIEGPEPFAHQDARSDDDDSDNSSEHGDPDIRPELVRWSHQHNISQVALTDLLKLLRGNVASLNGPPSSARTLLKTRSCIETIEVSGRNYYHLGLERSVIKIVEQFADTLSDDRLITLTISLNTDGLPLYKSSRQSIWPLLCNVMHLPVPVVFPITITCGRSKPTDTEYLSEGITEVIRGVTDGFPLPDGRIVKLRLKHIILDAQARSLVKGTIQVSGYYGCDRCDQKGEWIAGKVTYPNSSASLRTDASFRTLAQPDHHKGTAAFLAIEELDMIYGFPICSMHQVYLGVFRRLINIWKSGPRELRLQGQNYIECNRLIRLISRNFTGDFPRKPRDFEDSAQLKATELRALMLYCCPIALKETLDPDMYEHFLCLCVGIGLLSTDPVPDEDVIEYSHRLLVRFVEDAKLIYGPGFIVYNVHSLVSIS